MGLNENGEYILKELRKPPKTQWRKYIGIMKVLLLILVFFVGFVIGYFAIAGLSNKDECTKIKDTDQGFEKYHERLLKSLSAKNIESFSRYISKRPHIGGSNQSERLANYIIDKWDSYGFDSVEKVRYDVLLSLPRKDKPNAVKLLSPHGSVLVDVQGLEKIAEPSENDVLVTPPYLAYSPSGNVTGPLIYVNYGTREDFKTLSRMGENCTGKIAIMRYGKLFRGDKIKHAMDCGAIGVLLYCDPAEFAAEGLNNTYPKSWWLPPSATQRGAAMNIYGDPLTRGLPAIPGVFRININETKGIPSIPAHPIGYGDAVKFLREMKGPDAPADWQGGLPITYKLGPGFIKPGMKVRLEVNNELVSKPIYNVIGSIVGRDEPDRMVLIGSHRDAWAFGGIDATSAIAVTMEIARTMGDLLANTDWRPRRSIVFCSWGAEEFGLLGSTEWVEDNAKLLQERAVAYFNTDSSVRGNYSYKAQGSPLLTDLVYTSSQLVSDPTTSKARSSLYDVWRVKYPSFTNKPRFGSLGTRSDYAAFYQFAGVPSLDGRYEFQSMNVKMQPLYHTVHDTFYLIKNFNDPNFEIHLAMAKIGARMLLTTADQPLLPFSVRYYAIALKRSLRLFVKHYKAQLETQNITLSYLQQAVEKFQVASENFEKRKAGVKDATEFAKLRMINDQLMKLEQVFIYPYGLPERPHIRHLIFAPMTNNAYGSAIFPGITDVLKDIEKTNNWDEVKKQVSIVTHSILAASRFLAPIRIA